MGTKRKPGLTFERHRAIGKQLKDIRDDLTNLLVECSHAYPNTGERGAQAKWLNRAYHNIDRARCSLDSRLFEDHPQEAEVGIYYPGNEAKHGN